jgi:hypothetical protein
LPGHAPSGGPADAGVVAPGPLLVFEPAPSVDGASAITQLTLELDAVPDDIRIILVEGELTTAQLRDLPRPVLPTSLAARSVDALTWADGAEIHVAPVSPLTGGTLYTLGVSSPPLGLPFQVAPASADPILARLWPPRALSDAPAMAAVWCGKTAVPPLAVDLVLPPAGLAGHVQQGTASSIGASSCVSWLRNGEVASALPAVSPPVLLFADGTRVALEPLIMNPAAVAQPTLGALCADAEISFGRGCAEVEDDRVIVRSPAAALLWTVDAGGAVEVRASAAGERFVQRPLPANGRYRLATLDLAGGVEEAEVSVAPGTPRSHLVLNEVMANPAGAEPAQEWIELYNDGTRAEALAGYTLDDGAVRIPLPDAELGPGAFALVVTESYLADDGVDPVPAADAQLLRVRALGQGGLSNDGERLTLRDGSGAAISVFPAMKAKNGQSAARLAPAALDDDPASFGASPNGNATPGAANGGP